jgi:chromosome segregation ATPase
MKLSNVELEAQLKEMQATIERLEKEKEELLNRNNTLYKYCQRMDKKYNASVKRELSYREMLFVFNHRHAEDLLQEYIGKAGLQIQYSGSFNFRSN